jgi:hypothetical protein
VVVALSRGLPVRFKSVRVLLVASEDRTLVDMLARMGIANVCCVGDMAAARALCDAGGIDACLVVLPRAVPDEHASWDARSEAPGRGRVPALLIAEVITPYVRRSAAAAGYDAVAPATVPFRMFYRCIGALLQASRQRGGTAAREPSRQTPAGTQGVRGVRVLSAEGAGSGKPKLQ